MTNLPPNEVNVEVLQVENWRRYRDIRIASLKSDPEAFGGSIEKVSAETQSNWELKFDLIHPVVASVAGVDIGIMTIENLEGDFGATCWIGGCWVAPEYRGRGIMRAMFNFLDENANDRNWLVQGLGVWEHNEPAIAVYLALGFQSVGEPVASTSKPGLFYQRMIRKVENAK